MDKKIGSVSLLLSWNKLHLLPVYYPGWMLASGGRARADRRFISCVSLYRQLSQSTARTTQLATTSQQSTSLQSKCTRTDLLLRENNECKMMSLQRRQIPNQFENVYFMTQFSQPLSDLSNQNQKTAGSRETCTQWGLCCCFFWGRAAYVTSQSCYVTLIQLGYYSRAHFLKKKREKNQREVLW